MKNTYHYFSGLLTFTFVLLVSLNLHAQTCAEPTVIIGDDMESYTIGNITPQATHWGDWPGAAQGGEVSADFANSGTQSVKIDGTITGQDVLLQLNDQTTGHYVVRWDMYIPLDKTAYLNMQHETPTSAAGFWGFDLFFNAGGEGELDLFAGNTSAFKYDYDEWFEVVFFADIDANEARLIVGEVTIGAWNFENGVTNGGTDNPSSQLNSINFYPPDATALYYIDDVDYAQFPAAETGQYCYTATPAVVGMNTVPDLICLGGGYDLGGGGVTGEDEGNSAYWFSYTPASDGILTMSSCGGGQDTRGWIFQGECHDLVIVGVNDDQCSVEPDGTTSLWATYREALVTGGTNYLIMWDNAWESTGFEFELGFSTDDPSAGKFCGSAIPVDIGVHALSEMDGDAAVAGMNINTFTTSTTPYSKSKWYSYTPDVAGVASISSCAGALTDTYVFVYTGECGNFESLMLYASNDDGDDCDANQSYVEFDIDAGTTYYIEWIDRFDVDAFTWELCKDGVCSLNPDAVNELEQNITLFPNPVSDVLVLDFDLAEVSKNVQVTVMSVTGVQIKQQNLNTIHQGKLSIDMSNVASGIYFVQIFVGDSQITKRVVVE